MNCKPYTYIVGVDPVEKQYTWLQKALINLHLKRREFKTPVFSICFNKNIFKEDDIIHSGNTNKCLTVIDKPKPTFKSALIKTIGFYNSVKLWNPVEMKMSA